MKKFAPVICLAFYELTLQKDAAGADREYRLAEQAFREAITLAPGWVEPYLHLGLAAFLHDLQPEVTIDVAAAFGGRG